MPPERLTEGYSQGIRLLAELSGDRTLVQLGRRIFVLNQSGKMLESSEALTWPATPAGEGKVALISDHVPSEIAVVSVNEGRVVARVSPKNGPVQSLHRRRGSGSITPQAGLSGPSLRLKGLRPGSPPAIA